MWATIECLRKAGGAIDAPLVVDAVNKDGWVVLRSGSLMTATYLPLIRGIAHRVVLAVLATEQSCERMSTAT